MVVRTEDVALALADRDDEKGDDDGGDHPA
jgi:hypothetical protein